MTIDLKGLTALAQKLNEETDALNGVIANLDERLKKLGLGVSVWTEVMLGEHESSEGDRIMQSYWELGYARIGDGWTIAVRQMTGEGSVADDEDDYTWGVEDPVPLLKAPRNIRVEAAAYLGAVVEALSDQASRYIADIAAAKQAMK